MQDREHSRKVSYHDVPEVFRLLGLEQLGFLVDPEILYHAGPKISILYSLDIFCHAFLSKPLSRRARHPKAFSAFKNV